MKVLVTGGAGYIGSHAVRAFLNQGFEVHVVDNLSSGFKSALPNDVFFYEADIGDTDSLDKILAKNNFDAVIHFAAYTDVNESMNFPLKYYENNGINSFRLIQKTIQHGVKFFLFSSTAAVYGESKSLLVREEDVLNPISPYGRAKKLTELVLRDVANSNVNFCYATLRYFNVAGASMQFPIGQNTRNATHLIKVASEVAAGRRSKMYIYGNDYPTQDGTCVRDYIHVDDLVDAHVLALKYLATYKKSEVFNCGYQHGFSVKNVVETMEKVCGKTMNVEYAPRRAGDLVEIIADNTKIKSVLGWKPKYDNLELICKSAYEWELKRQNLE